MISDLLVENEKREHKIFNRMIQILTKVWGENLLSSVVGGERFKVIDSVKVSTRDYDNECN